MKWLFVLGVLAGVAGLAALLVWDSRDQSARPAQQATMGWRTDAEQVVAAMEIVSATLVSSVDREESTPDGSVLTNRVRTFEVRGVLKGDFSRAGDRIDVTHTIALKGRPGDTDPAPVYPSFEANRGDLSLLFLRVWTAPDGVVMRTHLCGPSGNCAHRRRRRDVQGFWVRGAIHHRGQGPGSRGVQCALARDRSFRARNDSDGAVTNEPGTRAGDCRPTASDRRLLP